MFTITHPRSRCKDYIRIGEKHCKFPAPTYQYDGISRTSGEIRGRGGGRPAAVLLGRGGGRGDRMRSYRDRRESSDKMIPAELEANTVGQKRHFTLPNI